MNPLLPRVLPLALCLAPVLRSQALDAELLASVRETIRNEMEAQGIVGLSAAIGIDGQVAWTEGFGFQDLENDVPASADTVYRLGSISKPVTAVAVMQLVEEGKIDLDADVRTYVPEWPEKEWPITIRQLLCHQGGVRHYAGDNMDNTKAYGTATEGLEYFAADPLIAEPGTRYSYSTFGFNLLAAVVEGASGMSFVEYLEQSVFPRAGTEAMQDDSQSRIIQHRAQGYRRARGGGGRRGGGQRGERGELLNSQLADVSYKLGGGGLCSTAADLVRFIQSVEAGRVVSEETRDAMWTRQRTRDGEETGYGLGFQISQLDGRRSVGHSGSQRKVQTYLFLLPDQRIAVSVMSNTEGSSPTRIARQIGTTVVEGLGR